MVVTCPAGFVIAIGAFIVFLSVQVGIRPAAQASSGTRQRPHSGTLDCMNPAEASATATGVAVARGVHRSYDQPPWVLDDPFALLLAGPQGAEIQAASEAALPPAALRQSRASTGSRHRSKPG
jgi:hypothetical protein